MNLAFRDVRHNLFRFVLTCLVLGLLMTVVLAMMGIYNGLVADALNIVKAPQADIWVVEAGTQGPFAEASQVPDDTRDAVARLHGVAQAGSITYQPIPLIEEGEYSVIQEETGAENVIHVTTESVDMKSSTCENQDCVKQGVVSLDNRDSRLLGNMIICLPNQVTLELYTTEELIQMLSGT